METIRTALPIGVEHGFFPLNAEPWMEDGKCVGLPFPEIDRLFFPDDGNYPREAKQMCAGCPVREQCERYATAAGEEYGLWGGTGPGVRLAVSAA